MRKPSGHQWMLEILLQYNWGLARTWQITSSNRLWLSYITYRWALCDINPRSGISLTNELTLLTPASLYKTARCLLRPKPSISHGPQVDKYLWQRIFVLHSYRETPDSQNRPRLYLHTVNPGSHFAGIEEGWSAFMAGALEFGAWEGECWERLFHSHCCGHCGALDRLEQPGATSCSPRPSRSFP